MPDIDRMPSKAEFAESLDEIIAIANYCINTTKPQGGVYGIAASVLLLSAIDAIDIMEAKQSSQNVSRKKKKKYKKHFEVLKNKKICSLTVDYTKMEQLYKNFRCKMVHRLTLNFGDYIIIDDKKKELIVDNKLNVKYLIEIIKSAKKNIENMSQLNSGFNQFDNRETETGITQTNISK